ncbi:ABC transporter substrate-binding protein [Microbispora amethystogenes]|uniref:ABC transporter substrate-binding protein n=1 Tax=Microbispora amethystogenes TaxID=1427754 RepID=A0ABQ4FAW1_9ACTN|nr:ABC transporter substrate-binding protein [Microbispora amethystogenes]GIH31961.1 ABC transporter substrate-binding protein [Microbispora amethystogenes]
MARPSFLRIPPVRAAAALLTAGALATMTACSSTAPASEGESTGKAGGGEIQIGLLAPLTGGSASDGKGMQQGAELAIKQLNERGGVAGYTFKLKSVDVQGQSNDAVTKGVQTLVDDESVKAVVTGYASTSNFEIDEFAAAEKIYLIGGNTAQTQTIIEKDPAKYPTVWSVTPNYDAYGVEPVTLAESWADQGLWKPRSKTVFLVRSDNPYSESIADGLVKTFESKGWKIAGQEKVPFGAVNDWGTVIGKIRSADPDFIVNTDYQVANEAGFMRQFLQNPTKSLVFLQYGPNQPQFFELTKQQADGVLFNNLAGLVPSPNYAPSEQLKKDWKASYGTEEVDPQGVLTYSEIMIYAEALAKVGDPDDAKAVGAAIGASDTEQANGRIAFDPATHLAKQGDDFVPLQSFQFQDEKKVLIAPEKYKTGTFRLPPWMK